MQTKILKTENKSIAPFVKWVGGKRQLITHIAKLMPKKFTHYYEPFVGGGAVLFGLQPKKAVINDVNSELINVYSTIKNNLEELILDLQTHKNEADYFYEIRARDRVKNYAELSNIQRASRVIYLNKTCFNGLYRVNSKGKFNTPFGKYKNPNIVNEVVLRAVSSYLNSNDITLLSQDFNTIFTDIPVETFVYFDPPYDPVSKSSNFTSYNQKGFKETDQIRLRNLCNELNEQGVKFLLSNSATPFIEDLYQDYNIHYVEAKRAINSNGQKRGAVKEVLIRNYTD